jgi:hypothetical protein
MVGLARAQSGSVQPQPGVPVFDASYLREPEFLKQTWLIKSGDDPSWARPEFDDSQWLRFDPSTSIVTVYGKIRPAVVWYRLHVKVDAKNKGLALAEISLARAFEVYVNGERVMATGSVAPFVGDTMSHRNLAEIPDRLVATGSLVIAVRAAITASDWNDTQNPGYYYNNLSIGQYDTLYRQGWLDLIGQNSLDWLDHLLLVSVGVVALVLFVDQRREHQYLWITAVGALTLLQMPLRVVPVFHDIPSYWQLIGELPRLASPFIWTSLYFSFVNQRIGWRWRTFLLIAGVCNFVSTIQPYFFHVPLILQLFGNFPFVILLAVVIPFVLARHWWKGNREAGILLIPAVLLSITIYAQFILFTMFQFPAWRSAAIQGIEFLQQHRLGPFTVSFNSLSDMLSAIALAIIMLQRSSNTSRSQARLEAELAAAQQVQQVLVPAENCAFPDLTVESVYQPAQQVGGDFFQVIKASDGGAFLLVGDVAGKGLPAAMLVSVIVGLVRGLAEFTRNPAEVLERLNENLIGRSGEGFCTALMASISPDGSVAMANAGHLSPYLDGLEVTLPPALPLGIVAGMHYETTYLHLPRGSRLTFYSDGVVEAQNAKGELFGFDRSRDISIRSAAAIVEAARSFGQKDDITVLTIQRNAIPSAQADFASPSTLSAALTAE